MQSVTNPGVGANNYARVTIAGSFFSQTRISVDGSSVNDRFVGGTTQNLSQESVQEFQISTFNFDLASGTPGAGVINIISRRGENTAHGSAFFYYRDHNLSAYPGLARDPRSASPFFARRQSGFSLSGPIKRDHLFWFGNYEHNNQDAVFTVNNNHPIFSKLDVIYPNPLTANLFNIRMDWKASERSQAFFRFTLDKNRTIAPATPAGMPSNWQWLRNDALQLQAGLTSIASSKMVNTFRASYSYLNGQLNPLSGNECRDPSACIGINQPTIMIFDAPQFRIGKQGTSPFPRWVRNYHLADDLTWQHGSHLVRLGGEWEHVYWKASFAFSEPAQITLWGPSNLQTPALKATFDALPTSLKDPDGPAPTLSEILQLPLRSFITGIGNPTLPVPYNFDKASRNDRVRILSSGRVASAAGPDSECRAGLFVRDASLPERSSSSRLSLGAFGRKSPCAASLTPRNLIHLSASAWTPDKDLKTTIRSAPASIPIRSHSIGARANAHTLHHPEAAGSA